jgi:predicted nucleic acid-binding protein
VSTRRRERVITDTSVPINFLAVDQASLLLDHPHFHFFLTDHVRIEVTEHYPEQFARLEAILSAGSLQQLTVNTPEELGIFAALTLERRLGPGECAAIAAAVYRGCGIAIDDRAAIKQVTRLYPNIRVETTQSIVAGLIKSGHLSVAAADELKDRWQNHYRFRLPIRSFRELL